MKKSTVTFTLAVVVLLFSLGSMFLPVQPVNAGIFDSAMTSGWPDKKLDSKYNLEMYGFDGRGYEFTPNANPNITCVFVASNKASGLACFPKAK